MRTGQWKYKPTLTPNRPVSQNSKSLPYPIFEPPYLVVRSPVMLLLEFQKQFLLVVLGENLHDHPFCDLRPVDSRGIGYRDLGVVPNRCVDHLVCAGAEQVDELDVLEKLDVVWENG